MLKYRIFSKPDKCKCPWDQTRTNTPTANPERAVSGESHASVRFLSFCLSTLHPSFAEFSCAILSFDFNIIILMYGIEYNNKYNGEEQL